MKRNDYDNVENFPIVAPSGGTHKDRQTDTRGREPFSGSRGLAPSAAVRGREWSLGGTGRRRDGARRGS